LHNAKLVLIHIVDTPGVLVHGANEVSLHSREDYAYLEGMAREIEEHDIPVESTLRFGNPAIEIIKCVEEEGFDLLVLGSHGHKNFADLIFGQTVDNVRHSIKIPVMVVRTGHKTREKAQRNK
jgi:manganese transport protein